MSTVASRRYVVPVQPWIAEAGRAAVRHGVYVYEADALSLTLGASNGSVDGIPLRRNWMRIPREVLETEGVDVADFAAREIRESVDAGMVMRVEEALEDWKRSRALEDWSPS